MALAASVVINRAAKTLLDETNVQWGAAELLDYLNAGISAIVASKPDTSVATTTFTVTNAVAKQTIPSDGLQLLEITRNLSSTGSAIRQIDRNHLNHSVPSWSVTSTSTNTPEIQHFMFDKRNPRIFYIYPQPVSGTNNIEIVYSQTPTRLTLASQNIPLDDIYENPLHHFVVAYAYAKNAKRGDLTKAGAYFGLFANSIGTRMQVQSIFSPSTPAETPGAQQQTIGGPTE
jgi:hypothetical protein